MIFTIQFFFAVVSNNFTVNILNSFGQQAVQRLLWVCFTGRRRAKRSGHHLHFTQHHIRMVDEVAVRLDTVLVGGKVYPFRFDVHHALTLLEEQNI